LEELMQTTTSEAERTETLLEYVASGALRVDRGLGVIRDVKVLGHASANGRRYTRDALSKALPLYQGTRVYVDHPPAARPHQRRLADGFGRLQNVRETDDGLFADLYYLKSHPLADLTAEAAERMPETLGLSHNAVGRVRQDGELTIVEEILQVRSVDLVGDPATTSGLFEEKEEREMSETTRRGAGPEGRTAAIGERVETPRPVVRSQGPAREAAEPGRVDWKDNAKVAAFLRGE
jgi:hypothetical protein